MSFDGGNWWTYSDEMLLLQGEQVQLETFRQAPTNASLLALADRQDKKLKRVMGPVYAKPPSTWLGKLIRSDSRYLMSGLMMDWDSFFRKVEQMETCRGMMVTAIALKRYQLKHGQFPETLASLIPEFLPAELLDPMSGKPFLYRRESADDFLLYSVGNDGVDGGGDVTNARGGKSMYWLYGKDWVWPRPVR